MASASGRLDVSPAARVTARERSDPILPNRSNGAPGDTEPQRFLQRLQHSLGDDSFVRLVLGRPRGSEPTLDKLLVRRLLLRGGVHLSMVWRHRSKDITKNLPQDDALALLATLLADQFSHAHLVTRSHDIQLTLGKKGRWGLRIGRLGSSTNTATNAATNATTATATNTATAHGQAPSPQTVAGTAAAHDRPKHYALSLALPFLAELGVTDAQQRLVPAMARKWRQINKFAEVLAHAIGQSPLALRDPALPVRVLDFGAGKGYLTFAVHHLLHSAGRVPEVVGVELRDELATLCNHAVARLGLNGLRFESGDVRSHAPSPIDIMIALHACDTATDVAMHHGVRCGAAIIVCSPCCHQQLRPQISAPPLLAPMLRHGIHMTEQAEMLTDSLRALLLQAEGYDAQVFEFISPEHTGKNKMVLAVRRASPWPAAHLAAQKTALLAQVSSLKSAFGVRDQALETLLHPTPAGLPA